MGLGPRDWKLKICTVYVYIYSYILHKYTLRNPQKRTEKQETRESKHALNHEHNTIKDIFYLTSSVFFFELFPPSLTATNVWKVFHL